MSATTRLLCGVRDSTSTFVPLKSIAGHLCFILECCEVWPPLYIQSVVLMIILGNRGG